MSIRVRKEVQALRELGGRHKSFLKIWYGADQELSLFAGMQLAVWGGDCSKGNLGVKG